MNVIIKIVNNTLLIIAFLFAFACAVFADSQNMAANTLVEVGKWEYEKGNLQGAIHEFSKALMLDPQHEEALHYLRGLGLQQGLYSGAVTVSSQLADLTQDIQAYRYQLIGQELDKTELKLQSQRYQAEIRRLEATVKSESDHPEQRDGHGDEIETQDENGTQGTSPAETPQATVKQPLDYEAELLELKQRHAAEYARRDKLIAVLEDYLSLREEHLQDSRDELIGKHVDLTRNELILLAKIDELASINDDYYFYLKHIGDENFIVEDEQRYLKALRKRLEETRDELWEKERMSREQNRSMASLQQQLQEAHQKIADLLEQREYFLKAVKKEVKDIRATQ